MIREQIRNNQYTTSTSGILEDYLQVNVLIVKNEYADEFERFGQLNPKACPIIERSDKYLDFKRIGPVDITRDLPRYNVFDKGRLVAEKLDLMHEDLSDYTAFAIGCSFTFEFALLEENIQLRHIEENKNVAMYNTDIKCLSTKNFSGNMVVSMRPIKKVEIDKVVSITSFYSKTHGIPVHIGHPDHIGIRDIYSPDYGQAVEIKEDELPVFWACGVTVQNILVSSIKSKFYTHTPGHMLITHMPIKDVKAFDYTEAISGVLMRNSQYRNMAGICHRNDIDAFAKGLLSHKHITLITGFGVDSSGTGETDGPMSMFLVRALERLGKTVDVITDEYTYNQLIALKSYLRLSAEVYDVLDYKVKETDCLLAIERPGKNHHSVYHSMRGKTLSCVKDTDTLIRTYMSNGIPFYAIGDGGNEVGMGMIKDYVIKHVPSGDHIVADIAADQLLVAGVSNWGTYCLTAILSIFKQRNLLQSVDEEIEALNIIVSKGAVDGTNGINEATVDGYSLEVNNQVVDDLQEIIQNTLNS